MVPVPLSRHGPAAPLTLLPLLLRHRPPPPEQLTDEWAGKVLEGADLAGLQQRLLEKVREEREAAQRERVADAFTSAVGKAVDCEVPESLLSELGSQQYRWGAAAGAGIACAGGMWGLALSSREPGGAGGAVAVDPVCDPHAALRPALQRLAQPLPV